MKRSRCRWVTPSAWVSVVEQRSACLMTMKDTEALAVPITPHNITARNCAGMVVSGFLVEVDLTP
jgi:hypothetical protein